MNQEIETNTKVVFKLLTPYIKEMNEINWLSVDWIYENQNDLISEANWLNF